MNVSLDLNVAFSIFNRPDTTAQSFEAVRRAKPKRLFVIADGPRSDHPGEQERCQRTRDIVDRQIDWPCEVHRNYSEVNLGCRLRMVTGYDWVFQNVEHCILLEDDCLPDPSFFPYCQELLHRYQDDERIMAISGDNFQSGHKRTRYSYYFSGIIHVWGWATWRRTWKKYDVAMKLWPEFKKGGWLKDIWGDDRYTAMWTSNFDSIHAGFDTWDHQLTFASYMNHGLCILPSVNLVSNIGFGPEATHTKGISAQANMRMEPISFPLHHPPFIIRDVAADKATYPLPSGPAAPPEPISEYFQSLNHVGVLNRNDMAESGEERFLGNTVATWQTPFIVDAGAKDGSYTSAVLKACPSAQIVAFEPDSAAFQKLSTNLNGAPASFHNFGFSDKDELLNGQFSRRLDNVVEELGFSKINLLRIDAGGNELAALRGGEKTIRSGLIDLIHFRFGEANMAYRTFFKDFWDLLSPQYNFFRLLPNGEIHISQYIPSFCEVFAFQNIVCVRKA